MDVLPLVRAEKAVQDILLGSPGWPASVVELRPCHFEASDWRVESRTPQPPWTEWVCTTACHRLVALNLWVITQVDDGAWRIVSSDAHSTVWDGGSRLFDPNFDALGISAQEALRRAEGVRTSYVNHVGK